MQADITSAELTDLLALEWLEPDIGSRIDAGFAMLALLLVQVAGNKSHKLENFQPKYGPRDEDELAGRVMARFAGMKRKK